MIGLIMVNKMRSFLLFFVALFRRALCCFSRRRKLSYVEPLTDIGVVSNKQCEMETENWNNWGDAGFLNKKPSTVQEHIEFYRQQKAQMQLQEEGMEDQADFFEDMTPQITAQRKVLIGSNVRNLQESNNLSMVPEAIITGNELGEWDESTGWDGEKLGWEAVQVIKEKKRIERERKALEQQQRRMERSTKSLSVNVKVNA